MYSGRYKLSATPKGVGLLYLLYRDSTPSDCGECQVPRFMVCRINDIRTLIKDHCAYIQLVVTHVNPYTSFHLLSSRFYPMLQGQRWILPIDKVIMSTKREGWNYPDHLSLAKLELLKDQMGTIYTGTELFELDYPCVEGRVSTTSPDDFLYIISQRTEDELLPINGHLQYQFRFANGYRIEQIKGKSILRIFIKDTSSILIELQRFLQITGLHQSDLALLSEDCSTHICYNHYIVGEKMAGGSLCRKSNTVIKDLILRPQFNSITDYDREVAYALQDNMDFTDDIDILWDVFEGDPDNYWNVD
jgi:hypothetical protein